jgi:hypothetical protein
MAGDSFCYPFIRNVLGQVPCASFLHVKTRGSLLGLDSWRYAVYRLGSSVYDRRSFQANIRGGFKRVQKEN